MNEYKVLELSNQISFPLYAASKELIRIYTPLLNNLDLTYTQYLVMSVLWQYNAMTSKELGNKLYLDSGTLTPLLNKLESKGLIKKKRSIEDERNLEVYLTNKGVRLKDTAMSLPVHIYKSLNLSEIELNELYRLLFKLLKGLDE